MSKNLQKDAGPDAGRPPQPKFDGDEDVEGHGKPPQPRDAGPDSGRPPQPKLDGSDDDVEGHRH